MRKIVILGGGYGGQAIIQGLLDHHLPDDIEIVLVDRMPFQGLKTEYYALAAGTAADIELRVSFPKHPQLKIQYGDISSIDLVGKTIHIEQTEDIAYDSLIIALGSTDRYHGIQGAEQFTNSIQSFSNTRKTFQKLNDVSPYGHVNIVGGGLSGVELAAELRESRPDLNISILDRPSRILSTFPSKLSIYVEHWFKVHHVDIRSLISVARVEEGALYNASETILSDVTIWTAGIQPVQIVQDLQVAKDAGGRIILNAYSQIAEHPEVYVIGDCASLPFAPSAQAAGAQAEQVAEVIHALWRDQIPKLGPIHLKGTLGALGKKAGFGLMGKSSVMGRVPRILKSGVLWMSKRHFG
jgi:NADH dehydrogenase